MDWLKEHWFKLGILIVLLIIAGSVCYYFVVYIPNRDEAQRTAEALNQYLQQQATQQQKSQAAQSLQICLNAAQVDYNSNWSADCTLEGKSSTCTSLLVGQANTVQSEFESEKDDCFKQYPQN